MFWATITAGEFRRGVGELALDALRLRLFSADRNDIAIRAEAAFAPGFAWRQD
jgi:hypothetical protein